MNEFDVSVVGLGFTGLPTVVALARAGLRVVGVDISARRVREILEVRPGCGWAMVADEEVREALAGGLLSVGEVDGEEYRAGTHVVCVPTPPGIDGGVDLGPLFEAMDRIAGRLRRDDLVLVQSTCPPDTIERLLLPRLVAASGLAPGSGFHLVHSPVRIDAGNEAVNLRNLPRVVAGVTPACRAAGERFLRRITDELVPVSSIHAAEVVKVFENTFRLVNISLVNELATLCRASQVDFDEVLNAAGTRPYGFLRHQPSLGAGGECIPTCAGFFAAAARRHGVSAAVVETAIALNRAMPATTVHGLRQLLAVNGIPTLRGRRIMVVGVTYKPDVPDVKQSAAVRVLEQLRLEAEVSYHDPYVPRLLLGDGTLLHSKEIEPGTADLVLVLTWHRAVPEAALLGSAGTVIDCTTGEPRLLSWRRPAALPTAS